VVGDAGVVVALTAAPPVVVAVVAVEAGGVASEYVVLNVHLTDFFKHRSTSIVQNICTYAIVPSLVIACANLNVVFFCLEVSSV